MIEVEQKFILKNNDKERLLESAVFLGEKQFTDVYYDTKNYDLTLNDKWLRQRERKFELKIPAGGGKNTDKTINLYKELEIEKEIRENLKLQKRGTLKDDLFASEYFVFCECKTTRQKYKKEGFDIDLDFVEFDDFSYEIAEIELMSENEETVPVAAEQIFNFAKKHGLKISHTRGKVIEYLKQKSQKHYNALVSAGQVKDY